MPDVGQTERAVSTRGFVFTAVAYAAAIGVFTNLPWGDLANHLTRITIISKLLFSPTPFLTQHYSFHWIFTPYILWDAIGAVTAAFLPVVANGVLWSVVTYGIVVACGWYLARTRLRDRKLIVVAGLFCILLGSNWFFCAGFFASQLSLGFSLLAVGLGHKFREKPNLPIYLLYSITAVACYLAHLGGFLALCIAAGVAGFAATVRHWRRWPQEAALLLPLLLIAGCYLKQGTPIKGGGDPYVWGGITRKITAMGSMWLRVTALWEAPVVLGIALAFLLIAMGARFPLKSGWWTVVLTDDLLMTAVLMFGTYLALPQGGHGLWDVDVRMLPYGMYFILLWLLSAVESTPGGASGPVRGAGWVLVVTCWVSLLVLVTQLWPTMQTVAAYRELLRSIPEDRTVFPICTRRPIGRTPVMIHQGCLYAAFREGVTPYIFDNRSSIQCFRFTDPLPVPFVQWYVRHEEPDWRHFSPNFEYIVVTKPFDRSRLPSPAAPIVFENESGAVIRLR